MANNVNSFFMGLSFSQLYPPNHGIFETGFELFTFETEMFLLFLLLTFPIKCTKWYNIRLLG